MTIPDVIQPQSLDDYLEIMTRAVFQAGVSWQLVEKKWAAFRAAFADFDVQTVSKFGEADIDRLSEDESILRSRKKIAATVDNARILLELQKQYGSLSSYLRSFDSYDALSADIRRRFQFIGELSVYYILFRIGEPVPPFEEWVQTIPGDHPRMREMVQKAQAELNPQTRQTQTGQAGPAGQAGQAGTAGPAGQKEQRGQRGQKGQKGQRGQGPKNR